MWTFRKVALFSVLLCGQLNFPTKEISPVNCISDRLPNPTDVDAQPTAEFNEILYSHLQTEHPEQDTDFKVTHMAKCTASTKEA